LGSLTGDQPAAQGGIRSQVSAVNAKVDEYGRRQNKPPVGAIVLIGLGVLFLLDNLGLVRLRNIDEYVIPIAMILVGLWLGFRRWHEADQQL
jgi:hypothetical protein